MHCCHELLICSSMCWLGQVPCMLTPLPGSLTGMKQMCSTLRSKTCAPAGCCFYDDRAKMLFAGSVQ